MNITFSAEFYPFGPPAVLAQGQGVSRDSLLSLQDAMTTLPDQIDIDSRTSHHFAPGLYARQYDCRAGEVVVGKIHKHDHFIMLVFGDVTVADEFGSVRMVGPRFFLSKRGVKRAVYSHTDAQFLTFHPTTETDLAKIEDYVIAPSYEALDQFLLERTP